MVRSSSLPPMRTRMFVSLTLGAFATLGCDEGRAGGSSERIADDDEEAVVADGEECTALLPSLGLQAVPSPQAVAFDFDNGNAPIELVIPGVVPTIYGNVAPGDATIVLRFTTLLTNSWFDAIAPYHPTAVGVYSNLGRRPASESTTNANMNIAILYASHHVLDSLAPQNAAEWDNMLSSVGLDPDDTHESTTDAIGIGNAAGRAIVEARENDGFNQLGFADGRTYNPEPYSDYTGYEPANTAYDLKKHRRWQPNIITSRYGITRIQHFVTPQYAYTEPYSLEDPTDFTVPIPWKTFGTKHAYKAQVDQVLAASAGLTDELKVTAELFDDKIRSLGFSSVFASLSRGHSLTQFVHYDFLANMAAFDVGIVVWQEKIKFDAVRPFSAIEHVYGDDPVSAWGGPGVGTVNDMPANEWRSYLNVADHPEYPSGSASFCAAHAEASRLYFGDDVLNWTVPIPAGSSVQEPGVTPAVDLNLHFATWSDFEERCGYSRLNGGVHFESAILAGFDLGPEIATHAYDFVQAHIAGTPP